MGVSDCMCVCMDVCSLAYLELHQIILAVVRSSSGSIAICYVGLLPVFLDDFMFSPVVNHVYSYAVGV